MITCSRCFSIPFPFPRSCTRYCLPSSIIDIYLNFGNIYSIINSNYWYISIIVLVTSFMTLFYIWRLFESIYFSKEKILNQLEKMHEIKLPDNLVQQELEIISQGLKKQSKISQLLFNMTLKLGKKNYARAAFLRSCGQRYILRRRKLRGVTSSNSSSLI